MKPSKVRYFYTVFIGIPALCSGIVSAQPGQTWQHFEWFRQSTPGSKTDKAAILIPVEIGDMKCTMQLDTGADVSFVYKRALPGDPQSSQNRLSDLKIKVGNSYTSIAFHLLDDYGEPNAKGNCLNVVGTLGSDFLQDKVLSLDLQNNRYKTSNYSEPSPHNLNLEFIPGNYGGYVPVVPARLASGEIVELQLDTGSSPADIIASTKENWLKLVGPKASDHPASFSSLRWGHNITCIYAPIVDELIIAGIRLGSNNTATYCDDTSGGNNMPQVFGVLGLAPFGNSVITINYREKLFSVKK